MDSVKRAVMLVAGRGNRMGDLADGLPKCLLEVGGISILSRALHALSETGVSNTVLVVGYEANKIQQEIGHHYAGIDLEYVYNSLYVETNTSYSLWLAKNHLNADQWLLEGDILFDAHVLRRILRCSEDRSVWAAVPAGPGKDEGILLEPSEAGYVAAVELVRKPERRAYSLEYKCAGIQLLTASMAQSLVSRLDQLVVSGQTHMYADLVLGEALGRDSMVLCSLDGLRWGEVDDLEDFQRVQRLFRAHDASTGTGSAHARDGAANDGQSS